MKDRHILYILGTVLVIFLLGCLLSVIKDKLAGPALVTLWTIGGLGGLSALTVLVYLIKNVHRHVLAMAAAQYELEERKDRWKIEKQERQATLFLQQNRAAPGTYLLAGDYERENIIYLPGPSYGPGRGGQQRLLGAPAGYQGEDTVSSGLPTDIIYEQVREFIPPGHGLLGVSSGGKVETCELKQFMTTLISGGSNSGKSNTVSLKIDEMIREGRDIRLLVIDWHARKEDSLYNQIRCYESRFIRPVIKDEEETLDALQWFYDEFKRRLQMGNAGQYDILLVVDEIPGMMDAEDENIPKMLKLVARKCGREARGFGMYGFFILQQMIGFSWLRNVVHTVLAHKSGRMNEAIIACNDHKDIARDMENWPKGRLCVYGQNFEGVQVLQMPLFKRPAYDDGEKILPDDQEYWDDDEEYQDDPEEDDGVMAGLQPNPARRDTGPDTGDLPLESDLQKALDAWQAGAHGPRAIQRDLDITYYQAQKLCKELEERGLIEID